MIRVIQRRLIIPRGDTGTFTLPLLPGTDQGDTAVFSIYDPLKQEVVLQLEKVVAGEELTFEFVREKRNIICPNFGFEDQLRLFEKELIEKNYDIDKIKFEEIKWEPKQYCDYFFN